jgi:hypothetical protein
VLWFVYEVIGINPRFFALSVFIRIFAVSLLPKSKPNTGHHVTNIDNVEDESSEASQVILSLLRVFLKDIVEQELERLV